MSSEAIWGSQLPTGEKLCGHQELVPAIVSQPAFKPGGELKPRKGYTLLTCLKLVNSEGRHPGDHELRFVWSNRGPANHRLRVPPGYAGHAGSPGTK